MPLIAHADSAATAREFLTSHAWHPDGTYFAVGNKNGMSIHIWNVEAGKEERVLKGHTGGIHQVCWHPGGTRLASASADRTIKIWDPASGEALLTLRSHISDVRSIQWSSDGNVLISAAADGTVLSWDASRAYRVFKTRVPEGHE